MKLTHIWVLGIAPLTWGMHFLLSYITAAVWCAKTGVIDSDIPQVRYLIATYSLVASVIVVREITIGYKNHRFEDSPPPHDDDSHEDRERFLGLARFLISSLSLIAIFYTTYVGFFFRSCR